MYRAKCGLDIDFGWLADDLLHLYACEATGYRFWRPEALAGDERFYREISAAWPDYYQGWRWEYRPALRAVRGSQRLLEIGCGRGYFLRATENRVASAIGLELNREAITRTVTRWPVEARTIEQFADEHPESVDAVCAFQVLEHVVDPAGFLRSALGALRSGGKLVVSTPDADYMPHRLKLDAFDLPPHHVGHFSGDTYRRIADLLDVELVELKRQPRSVRAEDVHTATRASLAFRAARAIGYLPTAIAYRLNREPGQTIMAVFRKR